MSFDALTQPLQGLHAIEASAGTGKTHSITLLWLRLLVEERLRVDQILVTTFTRAATAELQERLLGSLRRALAAAREEEDADTGPEAAIIARLRPHLGTRDLVQELETALSCFDCAPIHTIHGFCQSLISRHALELGCDPGLELAENAQDILDGIVGDRLMRDAPMGFLAPADAARIARCLAQESSVPDERILMPAVVGDASAEAWAEARTRLQAQLPGLTAQLEKLKLGVSLAKTGRVIRALAEGRLDEALSDTAQKKLGTIPALDQAIRLAATCLAAQRAAATVALCQSVRRDFPRRKAAADLRTFDDILLTVHQALQERDDGGPLARAVAERFKAAIVDECQDSDGIQIEVFQRLFAQATAFLVIGDPKQSIYRFRGADLGSYQRLADGAQRAPAMTTNFRSDRPLVEALNRLYAPQAQFRGGTDAQPIRYVAVEAHAAEARIHDERVAEPLLLLWSDEDVRPVAKRALARQTARELRRLLDEPVTIIDRDTQMPRRLRAADCAVLATSHSDLALVRRELLEVGIPCQQAGMGLGSVWDSAEAADVQAWLAAVHALEEGADPLAAMLAFAATPLLGLTASALDGLRADPARQAALAERLQDDRNGLRFQGPLPRLQRCWSDDAPIARNLGHRDGERRLTNWRHCGCLLQAEWASGRRRAGELALWLARLRGQDRSDGQGALMKLETDLPAVQLATLHAAKGLEYPVVCCPFLWHVKSLQKRLQNPVALVRTPQGTRIDVGSAAFDTHLQQAIEQEDDEQQRLLYVALTRARHRLYLGLAPVRSSGRGHDNGAERSALAALLGLVDGEPRDWPARCPIPRLDLPPAAAAPSSDDLPAEPPPALAEVPAVHLPRGALTRCSSYSALVRSEEAAPRDHDPDAPADGRREPGLLGGLGLDGNRLGNRIHGLLEDILGNGRPLEQAVGSLGPAWCTALDTILATPLPLADAHLPLVELQRRSIAEMHVLLPVGSLSPGQLSQALLQDPLIAADPGRREWARSIAGWSFSALHGFFQGYIDLLFEHHGRWYIVDYKTNALPDYAAAALETAMCDHHYLLQARLYTVALHRHLRATLPGYAPATHLGGCLYLFLRGFPAQGVWREAMDPDAIAALDALFAKAAP